MDEEFACCCLILEFLVCSSLVQTPFH